MVEVVSGYRVRRKERPLIHLKATGRNLINVHHPCSAIFWLGWGEENCGLDSQLSQHATDVSQIWRSEKSKLSHCRFRGQVIGIYENFRRPRGHSDMPQQAVPGRGRRCCRSLSNSPCLGQKCDKWREHAASRTKHKRKTVFTCSTCLASKNHPLCFFFVPVSVLCFRCLFSKLLESITVRVLRWKDQV